MIGLHHRLRGLPGLSGPTHNWPSWDGTNDGSVLAVTCGTLLLHAVAMNDETIILFGADTSNNRLYVRPLTVSGTTITAGTEAYVRTLYRPKTTQVVYLGNGRFAVVYIDAAKLDKYVLALLSYDGLSWSILDEYTTGLNYKTHLGIAAFDSEHIFVSFLDDGTANSPYCIIKDIVGDAFGTGFDSQSLDTSGYTTAPIISKRIDDTRMLVCWRDRSYGSYDGKIAVVSRSGTTLSMGTVLNLDTELSKTGWIIGLDTLSSTKAAALYQEEGVGGYTSHLLFSINGTTVSLEDEIVETSNYIEIAGYLQAIDVSTFISFLGEDNNDTILGYVFTASNTELTQETASPETILTKRCSSMCAGLLDTTRVFLLDIANRDIIIINGE